MMVVRWFVEVPAKGARMQGAQECSRLGQRTCRNLNVSNLPSKSMTITCCGCPAPSSSSAGGLEELLLVTKKWTAVWSAVHSDVVRLAAVVTTASPPCVKI